MEHRRSVWTDVSARKLPQIGRTDERGFPDSETPGMKAAKAALAAQRRKPYQADAPRPSTFPGKPAPQIPGQLELPAS